MNDIEGLEFASKTSYILFNYVDNLSFFFSEGEPNTYY